MGSVVQCSALQSSEHLQRLDGVFLSVRRSKLFWIPAGFFFLYSPCCWIFTLVSTKLQTEPFSEQISLFWQRSALTLLIFTLCFCGDKDTQRFQSAVRLLRSSIWNIIKGTDSEQHTVKLSHGAAAGAAVNSDILIVALALICFGLMVLNTFHTW